MQTTLALAILLLRARGVNVLGVLEGSDIEAAWRTSATRMGLREFTDERGRRWRVWDVYPSSTERRRKDAGPPRGLRERRRQTIDSRVPIRGGMTSGWLVFESQDGERRRLAPVPAPPAGWLNASEEELRAWCSNAEAARSIRRLIE